MPTIPPDFYVPYNLDEFVQAFNNRSAEDFGRSMKNLHDGIAQAYQDISGAINEGVDYEASDSEPVPNDGHLLVWKDTGAGVGDPTHFILFNDGGTVIKWPSS